MGSFMEWSWRHQGCSHQHPSTRANWTSSHSVFCCLLWPLAKTPTHSGTCSCWQQWPRTSFAERERQQEDLSCLPVSHPPQPLKRNVGDLQHVATLQDFGAALNTVAQLQQWRALSANDSTVLQGHWSNWWHRAPRVHRCVRNGLRGSCLLASEEWWRGYCDACHVESQAHSN